MSEIGVGLVGYKFMGRAHSNAYRQVAHFFDVDPQPRMVAICGRDETGVPWFAGLAGLPSVDLYADDPDGMLPRIRASNHQHPDHDTAAWPPDA